ncbi:MAG: arsenic efflux protein [Bacilli bacterium]|nr:arsenic efflux protein [Bacilli bacterium]
MTWDIAKDVLLDALKDSALVLAFVFAFHLLLSFIEDKLSRFLTKNQKLSPLLGSLFGIIPQCGTSVLAGDLYIKRYITFGTLVAVFLSCSDEAILVLLTKPSAQTIWVLPLIGSKFVIGFAIGYLIDLIYRKQEISKPEEELTDVICHEHHHEHTKLHKHFIHPLIHSLEIFAYVLVINIALGLIIASVGEDNFKNFLVSNRYLAPLYASLIGLIPNCASSVLLSELYLSGGLSFGALLAGLLVNSGLGMMVLLKSKSTLKKAGLVVAICLVTAIAFGYIFCGIIGF